eukprot:1922-Heterococcus_DN1.PRE.2
MPSSSSRTDAVSTIAPAAQLGVAIAALVFLRAVKRAKQSAAIATPSCAAGAKQSAAAPASEVVGAYESTLSQLCHVALPHVAPKHPDPAGAAAAEPVVSTIAEKLESGREPIIVGIAGGSGSGKTTLARAVYDSLGADNVTYICHDQYYKDLSHLPVEERAKTNFDHPDSLDSKLLAQHLRSLKRGQAVHVPTYDFAQHSRYVSQLPNSLQQMFHSCNEQASTKAAQD